MNITALTNRLRQSIVRDAYLWVCKRSELRRRDAEVAFYRQFIPPGSLVFDIGANHGQKTDVFLRAGAGSVIAVEPCPFNCETLRQKFSRLRFSPLPVMVESCAAGALQEQVLLKQEFPGDARAYLISVSDLNQTGNEPHCITMRLDTFIVAYGLPAFVKIDVEGHELEVLRGLSQAVPLSFEVNLPEHREKGLACIRRLEGLSPGGKFNFLFNEKPFLVYAEWMGGEDAMESLRFGFPSRQCSVEVFFKPAP